MDLDGIQEPAPPYSREDPFPTPEGPPPTQRTVISPLHCEASSTHGSVIHSPCVDDSSPCATVSLGAGRVHCARFCTIRTPAPRSWLVHAVDPRTHARFLRGHVTSEQALAMESANARASPPRPRAPRLGISWVHTRWLTNATTVRSRPLPRDGRAGEGVTRPGASSPFPARASGAFSPPPSCLRSRRRAHARGCSALPGCAQSYAVHSPCVWTGGQRATLVPFFVAPGGATARSCRGTLRAAGERVRYNAQPSPQLRGPVRKAAPTDRAPRPPATLRFPLAAFYRMGRQHKASSTDLAPPASSSLGYEACLTPATPCPTVRVYVAARTRDSPLPSRARSTPSPTDLASLLYLRDFMSLLAARKVEGVKGYEPVFIEAITPALPDIAKYGIKVVVNAGATHTELLYNDIVDLVKQQQLSLKVATSTQAKLSSWPFKPLYAQAYLGGLGIAAALQRGADIVICGRVSDASLVIGAAVWWHGWDRTQLPQLANAEFHGFTELEEGGRWLDLGYPIAEIGVEGDVVITKQKAPGGIVSVETCTA
ncbi:hypothetical protein K438DRAFT_1993362 [Mycena galopus ATCC 62051]|nr:hypothetical protein K438DRAFT_1993362 [Mycena galopus ATCC 62051]